MNMNTALKILLTMVLLLGLTACVGDEEAKRLKALESEVATLRAELNARDKAFKEELVKIRKNLSGIQALLEIDKERAGLGETTEPGAPVEESIDSKAKKFVDKNLDRLMDVTKQLLDNMEKELDEQMSKLNKPEPPEGDEI